jgi:hypothetical protein
MKKLVVAVDFDGTCVTHEFPKIGKEIPNCINVLKRLQSEGARIVLNTMRSDSERGNFLSEAVLWLTERGIDLYGVNENPTQRNWTLSPKVYAHIYIDDAALGAPLCEHPECNRPAVDWYKVEELLFSVEHKIEEIHK